jgi:hypothetical protein
MTSIQTLQDVLIAILTTVGIAVAVSIAFIAAGAFFERDKVRLAKAPRPGGGPAQDPARADDARELVLR